MGTEIDKKTVESLALVIASKTGIDENYALVARKVIADYLGAKRIIREYNESAARAAKKLKSDKKAEDSMKRKKAARKPQKAAVGE